MSKLLCASRPVIHPDTSGRLFSLLVSPTEPNCACALNPVLSRPNPPKMLSRYLVKTVSRATTAAAAAAPCRVCTPTMRSWYSTAKKPEDDVTLRVKVAPIKREGESLDRKRARLVYQSRKRGILETDLLLSRFAACYLKDMTPEELEEYDELLNELDWDIYYWATKNYEITPLPDKWKNSPILQKLQAFSENKNREILRMPDLSKY